MMKKIIILCLLALMGLSEAQSQNLKKYVISSGGGTSKDEVYSISSSISQPIIGRTLEGGTRHYVGFWYNAKRMIESIGSGTVVTIPNMNVEVGTDIRVPVLLRESQNLEQSRVKRFRMVIRYNGTVLTPINSTPPCAGHSEICELTITGTMENLEILTHLEFKVKLGNATYTDIEILDFDWVEPHNMKIITKAGRLDLEGVCIDGDGVRLVLRGSQAGIKNIYPNPAQDYINIEFGLNETGTTEMLVIDNLGNKVMTIFSEAKEYGDYNNGADISDLPNGVYFIVLQTPNELYSMPLMKNK